MTDEPEVQIAVRKSDSSLVLSKARSGLIARGRIAAAGLVRGESTPPLSFADIQRLAAQGNADAQFTLGFALFKGVRCWWMGRDQRRSDYCLTYDKGDGVPVDNVEAGKWFRKAADAGHVRAHFELGLVCWVLAESAGSVWMNDAEAMKWFQKGAELGDPDAQFCVAFERGRQGHPDEEAKWYRKAGEQGLRQAQSNLALMYVEGDGVPQDFAEAVRWYRKAADQGDMGAQYSVGKCYYEGRGVQLDYMEAAKWYRRAADQGAAYAQFSLGMMYYEGTLGPQDCVQAYMWVRLAVPKFHVRRYAEALDQFAARMTAAQIAQAQRLASDWKSSSLREVAG